ncbi:MAG: hypothetical protein JW787_14275 [Sedimentisphaerales bacterium]|nr:hypothetical protein [Sedimentisphaerales bacterium]
MDNKRIEELAKNPRFITGIYNYCDRWCERCVFTSRCMNYALSEVESSDPETRDINNKAFWDKLGEILSSTLEMVKEKAKEMGIDLDAIDYEKIANEEEQVHRMAEKQPYSIAAMEYIGKVDDWFKSNKEQLEAKGDELVSQSQACISDTNPEDDAVKINDCLEVIRWYEHQIYVKLCRAATGLICTNPNDTEFSIDDANGSAKVAIIGIERSIAAWAGLLPHFPEQEGSILGLLVILKRLQAQVESAFPNARSFQRPGFDTEKPK